MSLHTDTVDGSAHLLHLLHHIIYTVALGRLGSVIIVVEKLYGRVGLAGKLEHLDNELLAAEINHLGLAIRTRFFLHPWRTASVAIGNGLVEHIPCIHNILIAVDHSVDMVAQALIEHFLAYRLSLFVGKHPVGKLAMPCQTVSAHLHSVGPTPVGNTVGTAEVPHSLLGMYLTWLHGILGSHAVEVLLHDSHLLGRSHIANIKCHSY